MTEADLAKTLEGLSAALEGYAEASDTEGFAVSAACLALSTLATKLRTGQLIVVDHPQATIPVDDRGGRSVNSKRWKRWRGLS